MKKYFKQNAGLTLIELVVAIAMATIVTATATSVLLMGLRINRQTGDTASQQITVRALLNVMEDAATGGKIVAVESFLDEEEKLGSWEVKGENGRVLFQYKADEQVIYTNGVPVLEGVIASNVIMEKGKLLSISVETKDGIYASTVYCRTADWVDEPDVDKLPGDTTATNIRSTFIKMLKSQYRSRGAIRVWDETKKEYVDSDTYYSEWYIEGYEGHPGWNEKTPWCACYISWALSQPGVAEYLTPPKKNWYAKVDEFMKYFTTTPNESTSTWIPGGGNPAPGDLIFFDWNGGDNPQHVGVVLKVTDRMIYTIEGNSAGRVTVRSYSLTDKRIIGYGVLWPETSQG